MNPGGNTLTLALLSCLLAGAVQAAELRVMSFNIWVGGDSGKQPL